MNHFKLKQPDSEEIEFFELYKDKEKLAELISLSKKYERNHLFWDKLKHKDLTSQKINHEELWTFIKFLRNSQSKESPINDESGNIFKWIKLDKFEKFFHTIDMNTGGGLITQSSEHHLIDKQRLISRGLIEEAIASSQLEGAHTERKVAKKMLLEGRNPTNKSEQMIVNNFLSMKEIEENYKNQEMTLQLLIEIHSVVTENTLDDNNEKPRLRKNGERIFVKKDGIVYHEGLSKEFVAKELERMIQFSNGEIETETFLHPIIKAIMLHFWIGYLHPFTDGNGRLARLLFYWYLLREGYWAFVYLPISKTIKKSPKQYLMAYVYSEQDDNDLTYFINYIVDKIELSLQDFNSFTSKIIKSNLELNTVGKAQYNLNSRQIELLKHFNGDPNSSTSFSTHMNLHSISKKTSIKDLKDLENKGFLQSIKQGRNKYYQGTSKIGEIFRK